MEAALDQLLTDGGEIAKHHPKVKEIRAMEQDALRLLREQAPFLEEEPQQPKDQNPAAQRSWKQAHEEWDARREQYDADMKDRSRILTDHHEHDDVYVVKSAGRPIYVDREYIEIQVPGDMENIPHRPVCPADISAHREQYEKWKLGQDQAVAGTPLSQLSGMTKSLQKQFEFFNIRSVEQLAATSDANMGRVGPLLSFRKKAQDWMAAIKGMAPIEEARKEAQRATEMTRNLQAQIEDLKRQMKAQASTK